MKNGFTVIEVLLVLLVVGIVGGYVAMILVNNTGLFYLENSKVDQGVHIDNVLASIHSSIRSATSIASGYPVGSPTYTTSANTLVLKLVTVDSSNNIIQDTYDYIVYYLDGDKLRYKLFPAGGSQRAPADQILALNVNKITFQYFDSGGNEIVPTSAVKVQISVTQKQKAGAAILQNTATTEGYLRND